MQAEIAVHCYGWQPELFDFTSYFRSSSVRFYNAYQTLTETLPKNASICDIGGFGGVFPIVLSRLGYKVSMTESLKYYSGAFEPLFDYVEKCGVTIIDYDPFDENAAPPLKVDFLTCMAVLEHYPYSPAQFMNNIKGFLHSGSMAYFEVPNIAYWPNRQKLLLGDSPLVPIEQIFKSEVPFIGHHHEYDKRELLNLMNLSGFSVSEVKLFNYSRVPPRGVLRKLRYTKSSSVSEMFFDVITAAFPNTRECIAVVVTN